MSVSKLAEELVKAGQDITVLATTANGKNELNVPPGKVQLVDGVKVYYFKRLTKDHTHFSPSLLMHLHQEIVAEKKAGAKNKLVVHLHAWWNLVSIFSALVAKIHGVKVVLSPRGMLTSYSLTNRNSKFKDLIHAFLGKGLLKYSHIHATSDKERRDVQQTCEVAGFSIIPNFVRFPQAKAKSLDYAGRYRLLFLSRVEEKKGLELLFEALTNVTVPWFLTIAGTGAPEYLESLKNLTVKLNIQQHVNWLGQVSNENKFELIANHDLLTLTSYNENFANVVIESLAMGTPVLLSNEVGLADYVVEKDLGWVVPLTVPEIKEAINVSYTEKMKRTTIRLNAPNLIANDFDDQKLIFKYIKMYESLI